VGKDWVRKDYFWQTHVPTFKKILSCAFDYGCEKMVDDRRLSKKLIVNRAFLYDYK